MAKQRQNNNMNLLEREEAFQQLNEQLEKQTAKLVKEADVVIQQQENFLQHSVFRNESQNLDLRNSADISEDVDIVDVLNVDTNNLLSVAAAGLQDSFSDEDENDVDKRLHRLKLEQPLDRLTKKSRNNRNETPRESSNQSEVNDVLSAATEKMGSEAQIRFLKAKLRVMQEQVDQLTTQVSGLLDEQQTYKTSTKESNEELERLKKNLNHQQNQTTKWKSAFEAEKGNTERKTNQLQSASKDLDKQNREIKQSATSYNALEVRFNRVLEDFNKVKSQLQKQQHSGKQIVEQDQQKLEHLKNENKQLNRINVDSLNVIKKQQKLIGVLKRQILHVESAKLLSFTEDEFVKALDWGKN
ncbi:testis-expressed protein 9 [Ciona intestinalis]